MTHPVPTDGRPDPAVAGAFAALADAARQGEVPVDRRIAILTALRRELVARSDSLSATVSADFGHRSRHETLATEIAALVQQIDHTVRRVRRWARPRRRWPGPMLWPASARLWPQPRGVVAVLSPWNYPVYLALSPAISAIAAGNRVLFKPSEHAPRTAGALKSLLVAVTTPEEARLVAGGPEVAVAVTRLPLDHLIFTGSAEVGREVMAAAAGNLVPVTLELGGKCPALLAPDADLARAATRIAYGKILNAGQTCIAPDHVLAPRHQLNVVADAIAAEMARMVPRAATNPDYTAIITQAHHTRLIGSLEEAERRGCAVLWPSGRPDGGARLPPALVLDAPADSTLMRKEIFGPVLPIIPYDDWDATVRQLGCMTTPLTIYLFARSKRDMRHVRRHTRSGALTINETVLHVACDSLPFGGVGTSGFGAYHGREGFEALSHMKPVFHRFAPNPARLLAPPYRGLADRLIDLALGRG